MVHPSSPAERAASHPTVSILKIKEANHSVCFSNNAQQPRLRETPYLLHEARPQTAQPIRLGRVTVDASFLMLSFALPRVIPFCITLATRNLD